LRYLRTLSAKEKLKDVPDGELLGRFTAEQDEPAFALMVRRHGGMVLQVCRSLLHNHADADDAFQATFLVLARRARSIRKKGSLGSWLYGVAYRTALKAKAARATRKRHEAQAPAGATPDAADELTWREAQAVLHQELARLPEKYRAPLVLCYLEGKRQDEAGRLLGWPHGKLRSMLERARELLRKRLVRRGLGPSAVLFAAAGLGRDLTAAPAAELLAGAVRAAAGSGVTAPVASLAEAVLRGMTASKMKIIGWAFFVLAGLGLGAGSVIDQTIPARAKAQLAAVASRSTVAPRLQAIVHTHEEPTPQIIGVRASDSWDAKTPTKAFDGNPSTMWNAGDYAPQWLEADLGAPRPLASLRLVASQLPDGDTVHEVWVSDAPIAEDGAGARRVHTFQGHTRDGQKLSLRFPPGLRARYVQVRTVASPSWVAWVDVELRVDREGRPRIKQHGSDPNAGQRVAAAELPAAIALAQGVVEQPRHLGRARLEAIAPLRSDQCLAREVLQPYPLVPLAEGPMSGQAVLCLPAPSR
jgi:RNA polymerase sigma factor (sigma-70 family)